MNGFRFRRTNRSKQWPIFVKAQSISYFKRDIFEKVEFTVVRLTYANDKTEADLLNNLYDRLPAVAL